MNQESLSPDLYGQDGVNVPLGDLFSRYAGGLCAETYGFCPNLEIVDLSRGLFRGPRYFIPRDLPPGTGFHLAPDGIGTKHIITDAAGLHEVSAADWVAMTGGDVTRYGGNPVLFVNNLDVSTLGENWQSPEYLAACKLMVGLRQLAEQHRFVMYNGETAELGACISSENPQATLKYVWSGVAFGFFNRRNVITGERVHVGQAIVALRECGFRSNGGSSVRKALRMRFGDDWYHLKNEEVQKAVWLAAEPSVIYDRFLARLNGWGNACVPLVHASLVVHLTGGSFRGKFFEDFLRRHGFSAVLTDLFDPPEVVRLCGEWRGFDSAGFYDTFNAGQGVLMVVDQDDVDATISCAKAAGIEAKRCGEIVGAQGAPALTIHSKFGLGGEIVIE